jgi:predicted anti-sigma-YlaC factor YlaD
MTPIICSGVQRRLSACHDGELPLDEQIAVESHLRECMECGEEYEALRSIGEALRGRVAALRPPSGAELAALRADVMDRVRVEREESVTMQVVRVFDDMRLSFAALGATASTLASILIITGIFYFGPRSERPDSLAAMMETMGAQSASIDGMLLPRSYPRPASEGAVRVNEEDAVFALAAVVTRQGRIANLELVLAEQPTGSDRERIIRLLDDLSRSRFEPARFGGSPVAVNVVLLVAHTTVRGKPLPGKQSAVPHGGVPVLMG